MEIPAQEPIIPPKVPERKDCGRSWAYHGYMTAATLTRTAPLRLAVGHLERSYISRTIIALPEGPDTETGLEGDGGATSR